MVIETQQASVWDVWWGWLLVIGGGVVAVIALLVAMVFLADNHRLAESVRREGWQVGLSAIGVLVVALGGIVFAIVKAGQVYVEGPDAVESAIQDSYGLVVLDHELTSAYGRSYEQAAFGVERLMLLDGGYRSTECSLIRKGDPTPAGQQAVLFCDGQIPEKSVVPSLVTLDRDDVAASVQEVYELTVIGQNPVGLRVLDESGEQPHIRACEVLWAADGREPRGWFGSSSGDRLGALVCDGDVVEAAGAH